MSYKVKTATHSESLGNTTKRDLAASRGSASASNPTAHQYASPIVSILTALKASKETYYMSNEAYERAW
jgi:hypothetical protein